MWYRCLMDLALRDELRALLGEETTPSDTTLEPAVIKVLSGLDESLLSTLRELAAFHQQLKGVAPGSKREDDLRSVLVVIKETHTTLKQLRLIIAEEFPGIMRSK
jgi:hypothetical protein